MRACVLLVLAAAGCELTYEPEVGPLHAEPAAEVTDGGLLVTTATCGDSNPDVAVSFSLDIRILTTRSPGGCLFCHGGMTTSGFNLGSYDSLRRGGTNSGVRIIVDGKPCESVLVQKLGLAPPFGARMPYNGPPYFSAQERALVSDWIAEGALNN